LEGYRKQCAEKGLPTTDEIAVLFAMFPQQIEAVVKGIPAAEPKAAPAAAKPAAPAPAAAAPAPAPANAQVIETKQMSLNIDGQSFDVLVEKLRA
jgi:hypothetical protein